LIDMMTATIAPDTWDDVGGDGSINVFGQALIVCNTASVHQEIRELLSALRSHLAQLHMVRVQATWLWQTDEQVSALSARREKGEPLGVVPSSRWRAWLQAAGTPPDDGLRNHQASITCHSGQTTHVLAGTQTVHVSGVTPVVGGDASAYTPQVSVIYEGPVLQVKPVADVGGRHVTLHLHSRFSILLPPEAEVAKEKVVVSVNAPKEATETVERPVVRLHRLSTTCRVPVDQVVLVGGMTFSDVDDSPNLYLYVKVSVDPEAE
jgi:hypothetical protein